jgi:hypothetical protein
MQSRRHSERPARTAESMSGRDLIDSGPGVDGVPIDGPAERLNTARGTSTKTIQDAHQKLRASLSDSGLRFEADLEPIESRSRS